ncbi:hypothetical protein TRVL_05349 [Trypanosoma vivax]|nr:hypothetical protein TRVL_05349 [Trypanosoma vivax]
MAALALLQVSQGTLMCPVCYDLLNNPVAFVCGHVFCCDCATRCIDIRPQCPLCNNSVNGIRCATPLPNMSALTRLVREVSQILNTGQKDDVVEGDGVTPTIATATVGATAASISVSSSQPEVSLQPQQPYTTPAMLSSSVSTTTSSTLTPEGPNGALTSPAMGGISLTSCSSEATLALPASVDVLETAIDISDDNGMTQHPDTLALPEQEAHFVVVQRSPNELAGGDVGHVFCGYCALCGINIMDRRQVSALLEHILATDPSCDREAVRQVSERTLGGYLGPLWELQRAPSTVVDMTSDNSNGCTLVAGGGCGSTQRGRSKVPDAPQQQFQGCEEDTLPSRTLVVFHQACLEWCILQRCIDDGVTTLSGAVANQVYQRLVALNSAGPCSFCTLSNSSCLLSCFYCGRLAYHYTCALLTGNGICSLLDTVGRLACFVCTSEQRAQ